MKKITTAAIALCAVSAFAGDDFNFETASTMEKKEFVVKHAYKTLNAGDAFVIERAINGLPGNYSSALVNGLARNAWQAKMIKEEKQTWANSQPPMGDNPTWASTPTSSYAEDSSRPMRMFADTKKGELNYGDAIKILNSGNDVFDQGLVWNLFEMRPFTQSMIPTVTNERLIDAISRQICANAKWTEPVRLKYTSLAPRTYTGLSGITWSNGS
ncbi:hypothetical protein EON80_32845 [bacterium]|nr:MAG: hypothetical protein EON80_32845 [bacterium]